MAMPVDRFMLGALAALFAVSTLLPLCSMAGEPYPPWKFGLSYQMVGAGFDLIPKPPGGESQKLTYRPAQSNYAGVILGYKWLAGTVSFAVPAEPRIRDVEGISQYRDYRLTYYKSRFGLEAAYNRYKGYLIENSTALSQSTLNGQQFYKIPDLETLGYGINLFYVSNPGNYSLPSAMDQSEIQDKSGGATIYLLTWRVQSIHSGDPLIPSEKAGDFGSDSDITYADASAFAGGIGYGYQWVPAFFFVSAMGAVTLGYQQLRYGTAASDRLYSSVGGNLHMRLGLGVNGRHFFSIVSFYLDRFSQEAATVSVGNNVYGVSMAFGLRL